MVEGESLGKILEREKKNFALRFTSYLRKLPSFLWLKPESNNFSSKSLIWISFHIVLLGFNVESRWYAELKTRDKSISKRGSGQWSYLILPAKFNKEVATIDEDYASLSEATNCRRKRATLNFETFRLYHSSCHLRGPRWTFTKEQIKWQGRIPSLSRLENRTDLSRKFVKIVLQIPFLVLIVHDCLCSISFDVRWVFLKSFCKVGHYCKIK